MKNIDYLTQIADERDRLVEDNKKTERIIINPIVYGKLEEINFKPLVHAYNGILPDGYVQRLMGMNVEINEYVREFMIDDGYDYESWIKNYMKEDTYDDWLTGETSVIYYIRVPFFLSHSITELDKKKIKKMNLNVYGSTEGREDYGDEHTAEVMKFKWAQRSIVNLQRSIVNLDRESSQLAEMVEMSKDNFIKSMIGNIYRTLDIGTIIHPVLGYCNECEDCQGHECGTTTYYITGFCSYDFNAHKLRVPLCV